MVLHLVLCCVKLFLIPNTKKVVSTMDVRKLAHDVQDFVVAFRRDLHMHPEPSMEEFRTTDQICKALDEMGVSYRRIDPTGVIAEVQGSAPGKVVALRGDIDALSIQEKTDLPFMSKNDGFMHACGHDTHAAMLIGAVKVLNGIKDKFSGTVRFIFQPAEEIGKGAVLAVEQGAMKDVSRIFGIHITTMAPVGQISYVYGPSHAAAARYAIKVKGEACHGAAPHAGMDATVAAAALVMNLQTIVSRETPPDEALVVTVGTLNSGSRWNIVSGEAELTGTIRTYSREMHEKMPGILTRMIDNTCGAFRCTGELEYETMTRVSINDEECTRQGAESAKKIQDPELVVLGKPTMGGEDFAEYTFEAPATFFSLGAGGEYPLHSDHMVLDESAFEVGVALYVQCALDALEA